MPFQTINAEALAKESTMEKYDSLFHIDGPKQISHWKKGLGDCFFLFACFFVCLFILQ